MWLHCTRATQHPAFASPALGRATPSLTIQNEGSGRVLISALDKPSLDISELTCLHRYRKLLPTILRTHLLPIASNRGDVHFAGKNSSHPKLRNVSRTFRRCLLSILHPNCRSPALHLPSRFHFRFSVREASAPGISRRRPAHHCPARQPTASKPPPLPAVLPRRNSLRPHLDKSTRPSGRSVHTHSHRRADGRSRCGVRARASAGRGGGSAAAAAGAHVPASDTPCAGRAAARGAAEAAGAQRNAARSRGREFPGVHGLAAATQAME
jgi:hypothetical protein